MNNTKPFAALFDLDGVVIDTEHQYSTFWESICLKYLGDKELAQKIKGNTLVHIYETFFNHIADKQPEITEQLHEFEANLKMEFIPGVENFIQELKDNGVKVAVVTSSGKSKMKSVYKNHPELPEIFEKILSAEMFSRSKPYPDPYLLGASVFDTVPENCFVFEDSFNGLKSGRAAEMTVIGLATTNTPESIAPFADLVVNDFTELTWKKLLELKK